MLFASTALDANGWAIVIGAFFMGMTTIFKMYLDYRRERAKIIREEAIADRVNEVAMKQDKSIRAVDAVKDDLHSLTHCQNLKLDAVVDDIATVRRATNGLTDRLVAETKAAALLQGANEERNKSKV